MDKFTDDNFVKFYQEALEEGFVDNLDGYWVDGSANYALENVLDVTFIKDFKFKVYRYKRSLPVSDDRVIGEGVILGQSGVYFFSEGFDVGTPRFYKKLDSGVEILLGKDAYLEYEKNGNLYLPFDIKYNGNFDLNTSWPNVPSLKELGVELGPPVE